MSKKDNKKNKTCHSSLRYSDLTVGAQDGMSQTNPYILSQTSHVTLFPLNPPLPPMTSTQSDDLQIQSLTSREAQSLIILCINQESETRFSPPSASFSPSTGCEGWTDGETADQERKPTGFSKCGCSASSQRRRAAAERPF